MEIKKINRVVGSEETIRVIFEHKKQQAEFTYTLIGGEILELMNVIIKRKLMKIFIVLFTIGLKNILQQKQRFYLMIKK